MIQQFAIGTPGAFPITDAAAGAITLDLEIERQPGVTSGL